MFSINRPISLNKKKHLLCNNIKYTKVGYNVVFLFHCFLVLTVSIRFCLTIVQHKFDLFCFTTYCIHLFCFYYINNSSLSLIIDTYSFCIFLRIKFSLILKYPNKFDACLAKILTLYFYLPK